MKKVLLTLILLCSANVAFAEKQHPSCDQAFTELADFFKALTINGKALSSEQIQGEVDKVKSQMPTDIKDQEHYCSGIIFGVDRLKQQAIEETKAGQAQEQHKK